MEQGFSPRLSRVAAGVCLILLVGILEHSVGVLRHAIGLWKILAILTSFVAALFLVPALSPVNSTVRSLAGRIARALDLLRIADWLEARFESLTRKQ